MDVPNIFADVPVGAAEEEFRELLSRPGLRIERIVSHGHACAEGRYYDQGEDEWVLLLSGSARLWVEGSGEQELLKGDHLFIPARQKHRVVWTNPHEPTIWLAVFAETLPVCGSSGPA